MVIWFQHIGVLALPTPFQLSKLTGREVGSLKP
jgi:hypothetical protein